jgi:hypothetical protein
VTSEEILSLLDHSLGVRGVQCLGYPNAQVQDSRDIHKLPASVLAKRFTLE